MVCGISCNECKGEVVVMYVQSFSGVKGCMGKQSSDVVVDNIDPFTCVINRKQRSPEYDDVDDCDHDDGGVVHRRLSADELQFIIGGCHEDYS